MAAVERATAVGTLDERKLAAAFKAESTMIRPDMIDEMTKLVYLVDDDEIASCKG